MTKPCLIVGGVGIKKGRIRNSQQAMIRLAKDINPFLIEEGLLKGAPFELINVIFRYGSKFDPNADRGSIYKPRNELPIAVEVDINTLRNESVDVVWRAFAEVLVSALFQVVSIYKLNPRGVERFVEAYLSGSRVND